MEHTKSSLTNLFSDYSDGKLVLPNFQREYVWKGDQQKNLLASFMAKIPIGNLLWIEGDKEAYAARHMCFLDSVKPKKDCNYLLDGQQRVSTLKGIFSDLFSKDHFELIFPSEKYSDSAWKKLFDRIPPGLCKRWFLEVDPEADANNDPFGYLELHFEFEEYVEPNKLKEHISSKKIFKTRTENWWCPTWRPKKDRKKRSLTSEGIKLEIARASANEKIIPLWDLANNMKKGVHHKTLDLIAKARCEDLKAEAGTNTDKIISLLSKVSEKENIHAILDDDNTDELEKLWTELHVTWSSDVLNWLKTLFKEDLPVIALKKEEISRGLSIFETINQGGTPLRPYDLLLAKMAKNSPKENLSQFLHKKLSKESKISKGLIPSKDAPKSWAPNNMSVLDGTYPTNIFKNAFINLCGIVHALDIKQTPIDFLKLEVTKKEYVLDISNQDINKIKLKVTDGLVRALEFLHFRCGIIKIDSLSFNLMIHPIANILRHKKFHKEAIYKKIEYWFWATMFSDGYTHKPNEKCICDVRDLYKWVNDDSEENPFSTREKRIFSTEDYSSITNFFSNEVAVHIAMSAAVLQFILSRQPKDFLKPEKLLTWKIAKGEQQVDNHHIVPLATAKDYKESTKELRKDRNHVLNSPGNKTYVLRDTNKAIGSDDFSNYVQKIQSSCLGAHMIAPTQTLAKQNSEKNEDYYNRVVKIRTAEIKQRVVDKLDDLIS
jgi:hypothetical protein